jgi:hypothetical protein
MQQMKLEQMKHELEQRRAQLEHDREREKANQAHRIERLKLDPAGALQAEHADRFAPVLESFQRALAELAAAHLTPRRRTIVRGPDGRASHAIDEIIQVGPGQTAH